LGKECKYGMIGGQGNCTIVNNPHQRWGLEVSLWELWIKYCGCLHLQRVKLAHLLPSEATTV